ncbi:MAG: DUF2064 domain-containing protein [Flavobacteriales bacterium]|nr:DUF2064 domain-containing protein [Flavobacteriales bacterium]
MGKGTAILYFAYRPRVEAVRKPIFTDHGIKVNIQFYKDLQEELFGQLTPLGLPLIHIDDQTQRGDGFAIRICNALDDIWSRGYDRVVILGNDVPQLDTELYQRSIDLVESGHSCLLRTQLGGAGIIALNRSAYNKQHWLEIQWQTQETFNELFDCLPDCKVIDIEAIEINTLTDAYTYLELRKGKDSIAFLIDGILNPLRNFVSLQSSFKEKSPQRGHKLRGPPFTC